MVKVENGESEHTSVLQNGFGLSGTRNADNKTAFLVNGEKNNSITSDTLRLQRYEIGVEFITNRASWF
jgi:hypothetical protein